MPVALSPVRVVPTGSCPCELGEGSTRQCLPQLSERFCKPSAPCSHPCATSEGSVSGRSAGSTNLECKALPASEKGGLVWSGARAGTQPKLAARPLWVWRKRGGKEEIPLAHLGWEWSCPSWVIPALTAPVQESILCQIVKGSMK